MMNEFSLIINIYKNLIKNYGIFILFSIFADCLIFSDIKEIY